MHCLHDVNSARSNRFIVMEDHLNPLNSIEMLEWAILVLSKSTLDFLAKAGKKQMGISRIIVLETNTGLCFSYILNIIFPKVGKSRLICNLVENAVLIISWLWRKLMDKLKFFFCSCPQPEAYSLHGITFNRLKCERARGCNLPSALITSQPNYCSIVHYAFL